MLKLKSGLLGLAILATGSLAPPANALNIFGADEREVKDARSAIYDRIVYLSNGCTGSLVGRNLVLTAAHCLKGYFEVVEPGKIKLKDRLTVYRNYDKHVHRGSAVMIDAYMGTTNIEHPSAHDWAIIALDENLATEPGSWFEVVEEMHANSPQNRGVETAGYNSDVESGQRLTGPSKPCDIRFYAFLGTQYFDCDIAPGASGSPIWKCEGAGDGASCRIVGLVVGEIRGDSKTTLRNVEYNEERANMGVPPQRFRGSIETMSKKFANGAPEKPKPAAPATQPAGSAPAGPFRQRGVYPTY